MSQKKDLKHRIENRLTSRRQFLFGAGYSALALPPLLSLMSKEALAQTVSSKKVRTVLYIAPFGIDPHQWLPTNPGVLTPHAGAVHTNYKLLSAIGGPISPVIDASFNSMLSQMNIMQGLSLTGGLYQGHSTGILAGVHSGLRAPTFGKTIDVIMEQSSNVYKSTEFVPYKAIRLQDNTFSFDRINGATVGTGTLRGDTALFNKIFASMPTSGGGGPPPTQTQNNTNNKLIVDQVYADLTALQSNTRMSSEDKNVLSQYVASVFDLQKRIIAASGTGGTTAPTCTRPTLSLDANATGNQYQFPYNANWGVQSMGTVFDNYIEMIRLAFLCDLTRVVFIGNELWSDQPIDPASSGGMHHDIADTDIAAQRQQWGIKKMLKLAQALQATTDTANTSGTLLDNSLVLCTNELGAWTTSHNTLSMPAITFGAAGGFFRTGYFVDYTQKPTVTTFGPASPGRPYKQLLQSIMLSMGVTQAEYSQFGDGNGFGEFLPGINQFGKVAPSVFAAYQNEHNNKLPFIT